MVISWISFAKAGIFGAESPFGLVEPSHYFLCYAFCPISPPLIIQRARCWVLAAMASVGVLASASAQIIVAPVTPDATNTFPTTAPTNTGCDVTQDSRGQLRVFVWESSATASTIGWEWTPASGTPVVKNTQQIAGPSTGTITDPDVVVTHPSSTTSLIYILVTYLHKTSTGQPNVFYEMWSFNPSNPTAALAKVIQNSVGTTHAVRVNPTPSTSTTPCSSPNVDVNSHDLTGGTIVTAGDACIVFAQNGNIFARVRQRVQQGWVNTIPVGGLSTNTYQANSNGLPCKQPDVAMSYDYGDDRIVHLTYVEIDAVAGTQQVINHQPAFTNVRIGNNIGDPETSLLSAPSSHTIEFPRVATPAIPLSGNDVTDYCVVVRQSIASPVNQVIWALGQNQGIFFDTDLNSSIKGSTNERPVVTYAGDAIDVSWQYKSATGCTASVAYDVLQRWLYWGGNVGSANYSRVNTTTTGDQRIPCTAGRDLTAYYPGTGLYYPAMYGFYDANAGAIKFKLASYANDPLRPAPPTNPGQPANPAEPIEVYPNPATGAATLHLPATAAKQEVVIMDLLTGRTVARRTLPHADVALRTVLPVGTPAGHYVACIPSNPAVRPVRFQFQP